MRTCMPAASIHTPTCSTVARSAGPSQPRNSPVAVSLEGATPSASQRATARAPPGAVGSAVAWRECRASGMSRINGARGPFNGSPGAGGRGGASTIGRQSCRHQRVFSRACAAKKCNAADKAADHQVRTTGLHQTMACWRVNLRMPATATRAAAWRAPVHRTASQPQRTAKDAAARVAPIP